LSLTYGPHLRNFSYEDVHVEGAERIAEAVAKYDIDRFIHVSSYNADKNSPSDFLRTKVWHQQSSILLALIQFRLIGCDFAGMG